VTLAVQCCNRGRPLGRAQKICRTHHRHRLEHFFEAIHCNPLDGAGAYARSRNRGNAKMCLVLAMSDPDPFDNCDVIVCCGGAQPSDTHTSPRSSIAVSRQNIHRPNGPTNRVLGGDSKIVGVVKLDIGSTILSWNEDLQSTLRGFLALPSWQASGFLLVAPHQVKEPVSFQPP
jgi:hypothetical protein